MAERPKHYIALRYQEDAMTRWEYLEVSTSVAYGQRRPYLVNEKDPPNWEEGSNFYDYLNQLGDEGWEVIAVVFPPGSSNGSSYIEHYLLKRPKQ